LHLFCIEACSSREISNLILSGATTGLTFTTSDINLLNVVIKNSRTAVLSTKTSNAANSSFVNCLFDGNQRAIDLQLFGRVLVTSTVFSNNQYGLSYRLDYSAVPGNNNSLEIRGSEFLQNTNALLNTNVLDGHSLLLRISDSLFQESASTLINDYYCTSDIRIEIDRCSFNESRIGASSCSKYSVSVNNSSFSNSLNYYPITFTGNCRDLVMLHSVISDNRAGGLYFNLYSSAVLRLENNLFSRNTGSQCISLSVQTRVDLPPGNVSFVGNSFVNNSVTNVIYMNDLSPDRLDVTVMENRFENPTSKLELYIDTLWKSNYYLDAKQNWWGGNDQSFIESRIYDFYSDFRLSIVDTSSVYMDSGMTSLVDSKAWRDFDANSSRFCGVVRKNLAISMESINVSTINVKCSIHVPNNLQLQLTGSKIMNFTKLTGIVVEGWQLFVLILY